VKVDPGVTPIVGDPKRGEQMLNHVIKMGFAGVLSTALGFGVAHAQDEAPAEGDPTTEGEAMPAEPDPTAGAPADDGAADGSMAMAKKFRVGAGALVGLPLGDFGDAASLSIGVLAMVEYAVAPAIGVTGRLGYIHHLSDIDGVSLSTIPIWVGGKYSLGQAANKLFVMAELGFNMNRASVDIGGTTASNSETDLGFNLGAGYDMGPISLAAVLTMYDLGNAGESMAVNATAGYYFAAF
jgi:hypothetical protein